MYPVGYFYRCLDADVGADVAGAVAAETATVRSVVKGEMSAKTTHSRSAKGPTSIGDCSADGKFITLENTGRKVRACRVVDYTLALLCSNSTFYTVKKICISTDILWRVSHIFVCVCIRKSTE